MKKKIVKGLFGALILITAIVFVVSAISSYNYDMDPANGVDILEGVAAAMLMIVGVFVVLYELDLFYTVYYFVFKPKRIIKSILNIVANMALLLMLFTNDIAFYLHYDLSPSLIFFSLLLTYVIARIVCAVFPTNKG